MHFAIASQRAIASQVNVSISSTHRILRKNLDLSKKVAKLLPHELTERQKERRLTFSDSMLHRIRRHPSILDRHGVWRRNLALSPAPCQQDLWGCLDGKRKEESPHRGPQSARYTEGSPDSFSRLKGCDLSWILKHHLATQRYINTLAGLRESIRRRRPDLWELTQDGKRNFWLLHDNAPAHRARIVQEKLEKTKIRQWAHPPYSPDLSTCDFFVCAFSKQRLIAHESLQEMKEKADAILSTITPDQWEQSFQNYRGRLQKVLERHGRYFEGLDPWTLLMLQSLR